MSLSRPYKDGLNERLKDPEYAAAYLNAAQEDGVFLLALRDVAEVHKIGRVAEEAGVNRESLYRALSAQGNPTRETLGSILDVLGLESRVVPKKSVTIAPSPATPKNLRRNYRTHRRAKRKNHPIEQLGFAFPEQPISIVETGNSLLDVMQINYVNTVQAGMLEAHSLVSGFQYSSLYQDINEAASVPLDLLIASASTCTVENFA